MVINIQKYYLVSNRCQDNLSISVLPNAILPYANLPDFPYCKNYHNDYLADYNLMARGTYKLSQPNMGLADYIIKCPVVLIWNYHNRTGDYIA